MLDIKFIRENKEIILQALAKRHYDFDLEKFLETDEARRKLMQEVQSLRAEQNKASEDISRGGEKEKEAALMAMRSLKEILKKKEEEFSGLEKNFKDRLFRLPNIPDPSVPEGESEEDNIEVRRWPPGKTLGVKEGAKDHLTLLELLGLADLERGVKVSGFRGYFLKNEGVSLSFALWNFVLDFMLKKGFTPFISPALVRENIYVGSGKLPLFREDLYATDDNLYLSATAEIPMMGLHADEILKEEELPKKYVAFSPCYRREAGSYGQEQKGLFRLHEFMKLEQVVLCKAEHQESVRWHEELTNYSEEILQKLNIPYRVVINSAADLPFNAVKMYDIESWVPSEGRFRETHSASIIHDFQSRRLKIRYRSLDGKIKFVHSLNNTALATPRIFQALLENHQQPDGSVVIPEVLRKYMGQDVIKPKTPIIGSDG